ncbi:hypothetical protein SAMN04488134_109132 [Amphibacillus marinus]|uniref:TadE-like protein n=1 Tax=Amphibacillus marinus TaxID=872970 RepID=A0A1H8R2Q5_9BACI|nr:hypothetical protein [Amphibacillus marinus]SEO60735.1 hypothetical protein SAMN04488134_109132 [Amphibacillus marinus]
MTTFLKKLKQLKREDKGMFTLETTLIFPGIFVMTIALILFSLVIYEQVVIYQRAHLIAERVAFSWDNSKKDFYTGEFAMNQYSTMDGDGLYWRSNAIGMSFIQKVFPGAQIGSTADKLDRAHAEAPGMLPSANVVVEAPNMASINPQVKVTVSGDLKVPDLVADLIMNGSFEVTAYASVKDPVEVIRTTDFILHYGERVFNAN